MSFTPNFFEPGVTPCDLPVTDETKARLAVGGTFFRSRGTGKVTNLIYVEGNLVSTGPLTFLYVLTASQKDPQTFQNVFTESFSTPFINAPNPVVPLIFPTTLPTPSPAIVQLRSIVNSNSKLIEMPGLGQDYLYTFQFDSNVLNPFPAVPLKGGNGAPIPPDPEFFAIRTGPVFLLYYILHRDGGSSLNVVNELQAWNGSSWQPYANVAAIG
jgi:hypothetical protein